MSSHFNGFKIYILDILLSPGLHAFRFNVSGQTQDFCTFQTQDSFPDAFRHFSQMLFSTQASFLQSVDSTQPHRKGKTTLRTPNVVAVALELSLCTLLGNCCPFCKSALEQKIRNTLQYPPSATTC